MVSSSLSSHSAIASFLFNIWEGSEKDMDSPAGGNSFWEHHHDEIHPSWSFGEMIALLNKCLKTFSCFLVSFCSLVFSLVSGSISCLFWSSLCVSIGISGRRRKISDKGAISGKWLIGIDCSAESGVLTVLTLLGKLEGFSWSWHWALTSHPGGLASARSAAGSE